MIERGDAEPALRPHGSGPSTHSKQPGEGRMSAEENRASDSGATSRAVDDNHTKRLERPRRVPFAEGFVSAQTAAWRRLGS